MPMVLPDSLIRLNDPCLEELIRARGEEADIAIERLLITAQPLITEIVARYSGNASMLPHRDAEDVRNTANLRLLAKLRAIPTSESEAVYDFRKYVATIAYNAVNDYFRQAFPDRARLKSRLRRVLSRDERLGLWTANGALIGGLAQWNGSPDALDEIPGADVYVRETQDQPAEVLLEIFAQVQRPVTVDALTDFLAGYWNINDIREVTDAHTAQIPAAVSDRDLRDDLELLWREIRDLRPMQRKALLLNLRSGSTSNVLALLVLTGTAAYNDVAAALEMTAEQLTALWKELPLDDLRIAAQLNVTRQQVINLRKAAREKLARRMARHGK